jgi:cyclic pyranopterin phosphate synthase
MPTHGVTPLKHADILFYEEIFRILKIAVRIGVRKIRLTGGEPLARKDIRHFVELIHTLRGIEDLSMTTNGILLAQNARDLAGAGLGRVNISLDSMNPERYRHITRGGEIGSVFRGIEAAEEAGLLPIKINMVPIRGLNDDEIPEFAKLTLHSPHQVRFIEYMPFGEEGTWSRDKFMPAEEVRQSVEHVAPLVPAKISKSGPARYFRFEGAPGVVGFISPLSNHFCEKCNRLRLTPDGTLRPCLFADTEIDLKPALRGGGTDREIERLIHLSIDAKPKGHSGKISDLPAHAGGCRLPDYRDLCRRPMSRIGG